MKRALIITWVLLTLCPAVHAVIATGDFNIDGCVDGYDLAEFAKLFTDGMLRTVDLEVFANNFGRKDQVGDILLLNPWSEEPAAIVSQVIESYGIEQGTLAIREEGGWIHVSETSAVVAFETTERSVAMLDWGETEEYGRRLYDNELHYIHLFYLKNLAADKTFHLQFTAQNRQGTQRITGNDMIVSTRSLPNAVRIPQDMASGPPFILDQANAYYLLTEDILANRTAFQVEAPGITLDLGGHKVIYNGEHLGLPTDSFTYQRDHSSFGIRVLGADRNIRILNGTIQQGNGNDESSYATIGFNPIYMLGTAESEIAGITVLYSGTQISGIYCHEQGQNVIIHHNVIEDVGKLIANRHHLVSAAKLQTPGGGRLYNNLVKRARQCAFCNVGENAEVNNNEMHIESYAINSTGIGLKHGSIAHDNKIFGCGDNVVGLATTGNCTDVELYNNYIWLQAHDLAEIRDYLNQNHMESSDISIMSGIRITWGSNGVNYHNNLILTTAREGGLVRGTFLYSDNAIHDTTIQDNLIIALAEDEESNGWGAVAGVGDWSADPESIHFLRNTIVSNFANFNLQDSYGTSKNYLFFENSFVKAGQRQDYATIKARSGHAGTGHVLLDSIFEGGAGYDEVDIQSVDEFTVQWTLSVEAEEGAEILVQDLNGEEVYKGVIGSDGLLEIPLTQYSRVGDVITNYTPHSVTMTTGNSTEIRSVEMNNKKLMSFL